MQSICLEYVPAVWGAPSMDTCRNVAPRTAPLPYPRPPLSFPHTHTHTHILAPLTFMMSTTSVIAGESNMSFIVSGSKNHP